MAVSGNFSIADRNADGSGGWARPCKAPVSLGTPQKNWCDDSLEPKSWRVKSVQSARGRPPQPQPRAALPRNRIITKNKGKTVEKYRHTFELDGVVVDIDTWPKIPVFVELEGNSVDDLKLVAQKLGLIWENRFDGDPRFVYKKYGFDFDKIRTVTFNKFE